jgi:hypothetical protein
VRKKEKEGVLGTIQPRNKQLVGKVCARLVECETSFGWEVKCENDVDANKCKEHFSFVSVAKL